MNKMEEYEILMRNSALKLFRTPEDKRQRTIRFIRLSLNHNTSYFNKLPDWNVIMDAWELVSKFRYDNPRPNELEDGEFVIDKMSISGKGADIQLFQVKGGKWVNKKEGKNWRGMMWMSYNIFVDGHPDASNSNSLKEAIWKTVTDFAMLWCIENVPEFSKLEIG